METVKYNFGSNKKLIEGYINVDGLPLDGLDYQQNLEEVPYSFALSNSADEIVAIEVLEHITFKSTIKVLREWHRILKPEGILRVQVPDCGKMMEYYVNNLVCECVPHKDPENKFEAKKDCKFCEGKAKVNPNRWLYAFTGAQKHPFDAHLTIFTKERLADCLYRAGFIQIEFIADKNKLKVKCIK